MMQDNSRENVSEAANEPVASSPIAQSAPSTPVAGGTSHGAGADANSGTQVPLSQSGRPNDKLQWFAVMTQSNMEKKAKTALEERIKKKKLEDLFGRIVIPTVTSEVYDEKGKKKKIETKMMPGYVLIEMEMDGRAYDCVKDTPKVGNFLGSAQGKAPPPLAPQEVDRIINRAAFVAREEAAKPKAVFEKGEKVKVIDGPFTNFVGDVDEVKLEKQKLRLLISVFGRPTPVEIEFGKVEKIDPNAKQEEA